MAAPKDELNSQFGRTSDAAGNSLPNPLDPLANRGLAPLVDSNGRLIVRLADGGGFINLGVLQRFTQGAVRAPAAGVVVDAAAVLNIDGLWGYNGNPIAPFFLQLFDAGVLPVNGVTLPDYIIPVPGNFTTFSFGERIELLNGYTVAASSTELVYTTIGTDDLWFATNYYI